MNLRHLLRRHHPFTTALSSLTTTTTTAAASTISNHTFSNLNYLNYTITKPFHSSPPLSLSSAAATTNTAVEESEDDAAMNEFLARFVHSMRSKLTDSYPNCDKPTIDAMLVVVVDKLVTEMDRNGGTFDAGAASAATDEFGNEELTKTMWEVSNTVFHEMEREKKKEKLNKYLQSEEVKTMARFASEIGVRGDMLREMRFKWAKEVMEDAEFYAELKELKESAAVEGANDDTEGGGDGGGVSGGPKEALPKRHGKINYKLYGLDMSGEKWREVAEKVHEVEEVVWPSEAKAITGKCKLVTEKIVGLGADEDEGKVSELIKEWVELLQPSKVDWVALLENVKARDYSVYLKMAERVLDEPTFQSDIRDYSLLIDAHAKERRTEDVERLLKKMSEKGLAPDVLTLTALLHLYSKTDNLDQAKEAFEALKSQGFKPDMEIYNSMIMAYVNAGHAKSAEKLIREMEVRDLKPAEEIYMSLLQAFARRADIDGAQGIVTSMRFAGFQPTAESCTLLIQASAKSGDPIKARDNFELMMDLGYKPDDKSTSMLISAYEKKNELDKALSLLLQLEKDGFEPGILTYCVLVDWLGKLQLIDEAEQILAKIAQLGEAPPFKIQVSLCDMYARAGIEKKTLQALGVLEAKKDLLEHTDFERIIQSLLNGGFVNEARRIRDLMETQGLAPSEILKVSFAGTEFRRSSTNNRPGTK
ncbi:hypothetical protein RND81_04G045000 [Saponaria officinalis]|uniref:Pentacotripeptide-repeat region of PRORP domain-containing protein n=1 Tax=Saponaria officinalis TaxID=3572 RepID=A0AAW1LIP0_SAPOF